MSTTPSKCNDLPAQLSCLPAWVCWRKKADPDKPGKFGKVPVYANGRNRSGKNGDADDRAALVSLDHALQAKDNLRLDGIGLAVLPEFGVIAVDVDKARDSVDGDWKPLARELLSIGTYSEVSPSGLGLRLLFSGAPTSNSKNASATDDGVGIELFGSKGFVTITRDRVNGVDLLPLSDDWRQRLEALARPSDAKPGTTQQKVNEGRNVALTREAGKLRRAGLSSVVLVAALHAVNQERCDPPLPAAEVDSIARSIGSKPTPADAPRITGGGALTTARTMRDLEYAITPILVRGQLGTITGHPGHGKTTLMVGLCAAAALRLPFGPLTPGAAGLVYIVSAEDLQGTRNRILAEAARLKLDAEQRAQLDARLRWAQVESTASAVEIHDWIANDSTGQDALLIFIDTGPALFAGEDENLNVDMRDYVDSFRTLATLPGNPAVLFAWHPSKGATADRLLPRGASSIGGSTDFNLTIWKEDDRLTLEYTKFRAAHFDSIEGRLSAIELVSEDGELFSPPVVTLDTADTPRDSADHARDNRKAILLCLHAAGGAPLSVRNVAARVRVAKSAVGRHLQHLAEAKPPLVKRDALEDGYTLTDRGKERAALLARGGHGDF